ncbi:hypothetical protein [Desulfobacterium sp. N47]|uniref:Uncharacterized protein n=1 Tax=uncultured Desulfobacterium sp. TaxID=201089 RepID=E1YFG3_9BACT|nr:unknown protein [uncultured Desulfobacterium sp.]
MKTKILIIFVIFLSFLPSISSSESQPPAPRPTELGNIEQGRTPPPKNELTEANQQSTNKSASILPTQKAGPSNAKEANGKTKDIDQKPAQNWSFFDLLLIVFNGILAIFTFLLWWSTHKLWRSTEKTADLTYKAFIATNRPQLRIRNIYSDIVIFPVWIYISNIGGSNAIDVEVHAVFTLREDNVKIPPWIENISKSIWHGSNTIAPGEEAVYELRSKPDVSIDPVLFNSYKQIFSIIGKVRYKDANGTERETGFGWTYDIETREFSKPEKEDQYNYED